MTDPAIDDFFAERKEAWLKKNLKAKMAESEVKKKVQECDHLYSLQEWLPGAAKRAGQMSISTHPCTFSHPSARKNKSSYVTSIIAVTESRNDGLIRSGNVDVAQDALGNAAVLDVYKFLALVMEDGKTLLEHIKLDSQVAKKLLTVPAHSYEELKSGFLEMAKNDADLVTSSKIKQVYFPAPGGYHLLSILTPSGIVFELRTRLDRLRFGEEVDGINVLKQAREMRKNNEFNSNGFREIYGLTTIGYGGTKPQNISVLNNKNGGKAHLLLSVPPELKKRDIKLPTRNFFFQTISYYHCKDVFYKLHKLYENSQNNMKIRSDRDACYQLVVDRIIEKMWQVRTALSSLNYFDCSHLKPEQKIWLLEENIEKRGSEGEWLEVITKGISKFIFQGYEKTLGKRHIKLADGEFDHITSVVRKNKEALR